MSTPPRESTISRTVAVRAATIGYGDHSVHSPRTITRTYSIPMALPSG